jgi:ribosomal protein S21
MLPEIKRKKGETFESFIRRFNRRLIQSKMIPEFKSKAYFAREESRNRVKKNTLSRKDYRERMEFLKKTGRLPKDVLEARTKRY